MKRLNCPHSEQQKNNFTGKKKYGTFILLYLWAKYEPVWLNFTLKIVSFSAYFLRHIFAKNLAGEVGTKTKYLKSKTQ